MTLWEEAGMRSTEVTGEGNCYLIPEMDKWVAWLVENVDGWVAKAGSGYL